MVVNSRLKTIVLDRGFLEIVITGRVLGGLFLFCKSSWKVIDLVVQSIIGLCWMSQLYLRTRKQKKSSKII